MIDPNTQDKTDALPEESAAREANEKDSRPYLTKIKEAEEAFRNYNDKCDNIDKVYADLKGLADTRGDREFHIFWANLEILKPTIYSRPPQPAVDPRHHNRKQIYIKAAEVLERALAYDEDDDDLHDKLVLARDDLVTNGRGVMWVLDDGSSVHVDRCDFLHEPARHWGEVTWVARRAYVTKDAGVKRFGEDFSEVPMDYVKDDELDNYKGEKKAGVWELWDKEDQKVVWVVEGYDETLDVSDPMINVKGFFPCPRPAYSTVERRTLKPVPDFVYYRDQADEINELTARISSLAESLRLKGFYAGGVSEIGEAIEAAFRATDNKAILVPVSSMSALGQGSLKDAIVWLPVDMVAQVISELVQLRKQLIDDVYQITGLSDIMRGASVASETLGAQELKMQNGSIRIRERQGEMARLARDVLRIKAEIFAEKFSIQELLEMSQVDDLPTVQMIEQQYQQQVQQVRQQAAQQFLQQQHAPQQPGQPPAQMPPMPQIPPPDLTVIPTVEGVDKLLKSQKMRPFVLDVETDSTIQLDENAEQQSRMQFVQMLGGFIQQASAMVVQQPQTAPFVVEVMKFAAGGFRAGRQLTQAIDQFGKTIEDMAQGAQHGPAQQADPAKAAQAQYYQAKAGESAAKVQQIGQKMQIDQQASQASLVVEDARAAKLHADAGAMIVKASGMGQ